MAGSLSTLLGKCHHLLICGSDPDFRTLILQGVVWALQEIRRASLNKRSTTEPRTAVCGRLLALNPKP